MKVPKEKFNEVAQTWQSLPQRMRKCPNCGKVLDGPVQDAWSDNQEEAWTYIHCDHCGSDIAMWKIARRWKSGGGASPGGDTKGVFND